MLHRPAIDVVEVVFSIPYTDKKYIYFRHFSVPSLDSLPIVCYKPAIYLRICWKGLRRETIHDVGLSPPSVPLFKP